MNTITKRFAGGISLRSIRQIAEHNGTLNSKKIGRNRRGSMLLTGARGDEGGFEIQWQAIRGARAPSKPNQQIYQFADHRKLLKTLS